MSKIKTCNNCDNHSSEWILSRELARVNKRLFISLILVIILWFSTILGFVIYLNQYDFTSETVTTQNETITVDSGDGGTANYIGNNGDITYGENNSP